MGNLFPVLVLAGRIIDVDAMAEEEGVDKMKLITALTSSEKPFETHGYANEYGAARRAFMASSIHSLEETAALKAMAAKYAIPSSSVSLIQTKTYGH